MVAQTPIFGVPFLQEQLEGLPYGEKLRIKKTVTEADLDIWHANRSGYYNMLDILLRIGAAGNIILSGDVHYGFVAQGTIAAAGNQITFTQFTSSSLKNMPGDKTFAERFTVANLSSAQARSQNGVVEVGWRRAPQPINPRTSARILGILKKSPAVLTLSEISDARVSFRRSDPGVTQISYSTVRPSIPRDGDCVHRRTNLGQLVLTLNGKAILRLYPSGSFRPFATYEFPLPAPVNERFTVAADTLFDFDKAVLKAEGRARLDDVVSTLAGADIEKITVVGHTDSVGTAVYNVRLSVRRAEAVKAYLVGKDIEPDLIETDGKGEAEPIADNGTAEGRAQNRRVEIGVIGTRPINR